MSDLEMYIVLGLFVLSIPPFLYILYVVMVVTPRVLKYNGFNDKGGYRWNLCQTNFFMIAFHPTEFVKRSKYFKETLQFYSAEPRDIKHFWNYKLITFTYAVVITLWILIENIEHISI